MSTFLENSPVEQLIGAVDAITRQSASPPDDVLLADLRAAWEGNHHGMLPRAFFAAVEQAPAAISLTDLDARILYANPVFETVTGHKVADVIGRNESLLSDKRTPRRVYETMWQSLCAGESWSGRLINRRKDKRRYLAELTITPLRDSHGAVIHYLGVHRDITAMYQLERRVRNQKRLIESIIDGAPVAMVLLDEGGSEAMSNAAYRSLVGEFGGISGDRGSLVASLRTAIEAEWTVSGSTPREPGPLFHDVEIAVETGGAPLRPGEGEVPWPPSGDGVRWFSCSASRLVGSDEDADAFFAPRERVHDLLVINEVTRLKRQQEAVRQNALRALVAEEARVEALREAIDAAAFQLQGPLNLLRAALKLRAHQAPVGSEAALDDVLEQVLLAGGQAIDQLHDAMPRTETSSPEPVDMNAVVGDILALATERMLASGVVVDWRPLAGVPHLNGHENRLRALVKQLLDNALDALEEQPADAPRELSARLESDGNELLLCLTDSGPGIPVEVRGRVFEPFFTTRAGRGHGGMGLAIAREILNQHGASIDFDHDRPGCRLTIRFPLCPRPVRETVTRTTP